MAAAGAEGLGTTLVVLGLVFIAALLADYIGRRSHLPRVTLLLVVGLVLGPTLLDFQPGLRDAAFDVVTLLALTFVGFSLGSGFTRQWLREHGGPVLTISIVVVAVTAVIVFFGILGLAEAGYLEADGLLVVAILLAGVATATAPAATRDVVEEADVPGRFSQRLLAIVAIDDAWGVILFSVLLAVSTGISGGTGITEILIGGAREVFGAVLLGVALGIPLAFAADRTKYDRSALALTLGTTILCTGLAQYFGVSFLLATMVLGATLANMAHNRRQHFAALEWAEWPVITLFFVLAGASLHLEKLWAVGALGAAYILLRIVGRVAGGWLGAVLARTDTHTRRWIGPALLPQAGIAIGLAFVAAERFPEHRDVIMTVVIGSTVVFELIGPVITRFALRKGGDFEPTQEAL